MPSSGEEPSPSFPIYMPGRMRMCSRQSSERILSSVYWVASGMAIKIVFQRLNRKGHPLKKLTNLKAKLLKGLHFNQQFFPGIFYRFFFTLATVSPQISLTPMKNLQLFPGFHNPKPIVNTFFVFDKVFYGFSEMQIVHTFSSVSKKSLANIKSPLDYIIEKQKADNDQITKLKT